MAFSHPEVVLHIGCRKSGTSYLQQALHRSRVALDAQGLTIPLGRRGGHVRELLDPLRRAVLQDEVRPARRAVRALVKRLEQEEATRFLVTLEDLAELPGPAAVDELLDGLADYPVKVLITARHWGVSIPSEWQQSVKERLTTPYWDFIEDIQQRKPQAARFLARQDLPDIAARWGSGRGDVDVAVVAVPTSSEGSNDLTTLFCSELGVDPGTLSAPSSAINRSLDYPQAELLRRVNVALGDRLTDIRREYRPAVRIWLARGSLMKGDRDRISLPPEFVPWVHQESQRQVEQLRQQGVRIVGDEADLLAPASADGHGPRASAEQVGELAIRTLADLVTARWEETRAQEGRSQG